MFVYMCVCTILLQQVSLTISGTKQTYQMTPVNINLTTLVREAFPLLVQHVPVLVQLNLCVSITRF